MEKNEGQRETEKESEPVAEKAIWTAPLVPPRYRPPLTPEQIEACEEIIKIMGIDPDSFTEEEIKEISKAWE